MSQAARILFHTREEDSDSAPLSRRSLSRASRPLPPFLARLEVQCNCKLTMRPECLVGKLPGCRERRHYRRCACEVALLPVCVAAEGIGCPDRQLGKKCRCAQAMLPLCFALGCRERREGHNCDCPRTPGLPCHHIQALLARYGRLTPEELNQFLDWWGKKLEDADYETYMERPEPAPDVVLTPEERVILRLNRENMGVALFHPQDVLHFASDREQEIQTRRAIDFLRLVHKQRRKHGRK